MFSKCFKVGTGRSTASRTAAAFWVLTKAVSYLHVVVSFTRTLYQHFQNER
jgi:hypothetical protein